MGIFGKKKVSIVAHAEGGKGGDARGKKSQGGRGGDATNYVYTVIAEEMHHGGSHPRSKMAKFDAAVDMAEKITGTKIRGTEHYNTLFREHFNAKL